MFVLCSKLEMRAISPTQTSFPIPPKNPRKTHIHRPKCNTLQHFATFTPLPPPNTQGGGLQLSTIHYQLSIIHYSPLSLYSYPVPNPSLKGASPWLPTPPVISEMSSSSATALLARPPSPTP